MKKLLVFLTVFVVLLNLVGCSGNEDIRGDITSDTTNISENTSSDAETEKEFSMGSTSGNTYENEFIGIGCKLSSEWTFYTDAQIKELNNIALDTVGEDIAEQIKDADIIYDMYALNVDGMSSINVNLEKTNALVVAVTDLEKYLNSSIPTLKEALENMGCSNINTEIQDFKVGTDDFKGIKITAEINGIKMYETVMCKKAGAYMANVTIATFNEDKTQDIINGFYTLKD